MYWFKNLKTRNKILLSFASVLVLFMLASIFTYFSLNGAKNEEAKAIEDIKIDTFLAEKISDHVSYVEKLQRSILFEHKFDGQLDPAKCSFGKWYAEFKPENGQEKVLYDAINDSHMELHKHAEHIKSLQESNISKEVQGKYYQENILPTVEKVRTGINNFSEFVGKEADAAADKSYAALDYVKDTFMLIILIAIVLGISVSVFLSRLISNPVKNLSDAANKFAAGDKNVVVKIDSKDEFGDLATAFNNMVEKIEMQIQYLDNLAAPVMVINKEFGIQYMNKTGAAILGKTQQELTMQKCYDNFKTGDCRTDKCACAQAMNKNIVATEETIANPNGKTLPIQYTGAPIKNKSGDIIGAVEFVTDITDIKEARNYLARGTNALLVEMDKFADGDLTVEVVPEKENDDIGKLFHGFNKSVQNIKDIVQNVIAAVEATASASAEISSSSEEMAAGAQEQSSQTTEIAGAVEEMTKTILETSQNSSKSAEAAKSAGVTAKEGGRVVEQTIEGMNRIAEVVKKSAETVHALGRGSDQIGEIVQVINDIADQTNLLALNAAIEAARAGEQGKGFAVVADEVRKLAERTTKATKEIAVMIKQIQKDTGGAVESMNKGTEEVEKGKALADKAGQSLKEIILGVEQVVDMSTQVAAASEEQSSAAEQISKNIEAISSVTNESASGIQQIARAAEDLNRLTVNLQELASRFKIDGSSSNGNKRTRVVKSALAVRSNGVVVPR
ncbi:MAG: methyl-accepting chemotaxis protein [Ignavibacteria bacterium]|nr:methyl-accepting chemotaxis protein [Ignavibacteria bacterium]